MAVRRGRPVGSGKKQKTEVVAKYDAAGQGRRMRGWSPASTGPNAAITGLQTIRNRARDASRNDWSGESGVQKWATTLIGIGITPRFKRIASKVRKQQITDWWTDFLSEMDADGASHGYAMQTLVVRSWFESGEIFARRRARRIGENLTVPFQVQLIEADFVPMLDADMCPGMPVGNRIRSGIELTRIGRRAAYWFYKEHPGDGKGTNINSSDLVRIPADEILHVYELKRPGQLRGVPGMAPVLARMRSIGDYDDAVLERQKLANLFVSFITRNLPGGFDDVDPATGQPLEFSASDEPLVGLQPGLQVELDPGQDVKFSNPPEAGTTYSEYMRTQNLGTAAASGIPYELFSGDIQNISDRTLRVLINEFRRLAEQRQWQIVIPRYCQPVIDWFADGLYLAGKISQTEIEAVRRVEHSPHGWSHIHPVQDPQGKIIEIAAGLRSRSATIGERGDDAEAVDDERASDKKREDRLGLTPVAPAPAPGKPGEQGSQQGEPGKKKGANARADDDVIDDIDDTVKLALMGRVVGMLEALDD